MDEALMTCDRLVTVKIEGTSGAVCAGQNAMDSKEQQKAEQGGVWLTRLGTKYRLTLHCQYSTSSSSDSCSQLPATLHQTGLPGYFPSQDFYVYFTTFASSCPSIMN